MKCRIRWEKKKFDDIGTLTILFSFMVSYYLFGVFLSVYYFQVSFNFNSNFVDGQNNSKYLDCVLLIFIYKQRGVYA